MSDIETRPANNAMANKKRNPYTVWFVVLAFVAPVVLAYIMFFFVDVKSFVNHGEILNPIVHIKDFKLKDENNEIIATDVLTYKWRLISFLGGECDEACAARLYDSRQVHAALGKDRHRVLRMFVHREPAGAELSKLIEETHANVIHVYASDDDISKALGTNIREDAGFKSNETYIMDPMGNVMMRFTVDQPNKDFLFDLRKLLKASQIG